MRRVRATLASVTFAFGIGCTGSAPPPDDSALAGGDTAAQVRGDVGELQAEVARLEQRLRALARAEGCESAGQCKTAPVGERACGGPREYVVYCPIATDETALLAVVDSLKQAELRHNEATGAISTCEYRMPPQTAVAEGRCVAARAP